MPSKPKYFGTEIVARELGLRHDRPVSQEDYEASATEPMRQADIAWAVWRAKTRPALYSADALAGFKLSNYGPSKRAMVNFALSLVGKPYVWAGEWTKRTGRRYPYGAQEHGGFDCSGFIWYVLKKKNSVYRPIDRHYEGWKIGQRSAADMAAATRRRISYRKLRPGDIVFFAPRGRNSRARTVYHAGIYLGRGWMVHSSASRAGVSLADISRNSWWHGQIAWGRRVI
jgi:cell wall-associated NlpC family hydrolase